MKWTEKMDAALTKLWATGASCSQIALQLRWNVSRNAVIGRAHRLGLESRPSPIRGSFSGLSEGGKRNRAHKLRRAPDYEDRLQPPPLFAEPHEAMTEPPLPIGAKSSKRCQFITGSPDHTETCKCNRPALNGPWCEEHRRVVWMKKPKEAV